MAQRATPEEFWRSKMQTQVTAPANQPLPVQMTYSPQMLQFPEINASGLIIIGIVAVVGLVGLFALLGSAGKCKC